MYSQNGMREKLTVGFYSIVSFCHVMAVTFGSEEIANISKAMLMPTLIFLVFVMAGGNVTLPRLLLSLALVFSWIGDILPINEGNSFFLGGLGAFLVAQGLYGFVLHQSTDGNIKFQLKPLVPAFIYGILLLSLLIPNAGNLALPIAIYAICILTMVSIAILRKKLTGEDSFLYAAFGAVFFVVSDSLIALDKFVTPVPFADFLIMTTYVVAQYFLVRGVMMHERH